MTAPTLVRHALNVDRGVAILDARLGRNVWLPRIDFATLKVESCDHCVVCQATGIPWYGDALDSIGLNLQVMYESWDSSASWTEAHGFGLAIVPGGNRDFPGLQEAWVQRIRQLRGEASA